MMKRILRPHDPQQRCFPAVDAPPDASAEAAPDLPPDIREALRLLALEDEKLPAGRRILPLGLTPEQRLGRLLHHRQQAIKAEQEGLWKRADFYWRQAHRALKALTSRSSLWRALARQTAKHGAEILADPDQLRNRVVEELFVDLHCAFCNGRAFSGRRKKARKLPLEDRFWVHVDYLRDLLPLWDAPVEERAVFFLPLLDHRLGRLMKGAKRIEAWKYAARVDRLLPGNRTVRQRHIRAHLEIVADEVGELSGQGRSDTQHDIAVLQRHLAAVRKLCTDEGACLEAFHAMGLLHRRHAAGLAHLTQLAEGLREVQKSLAYWPFDQEGEELQQQILAAQESLRRQMQQLLRQLQGQPGKQLNSEGEKLQRQIKVGDSLARRFAESKEAEDIRQRLESLWERESQRQSEEPAQEAAEQAAKGPQVQPFSLPSPAEASPQDREPAGPWLVSGQDLRVKAQAVAAVLLLLLAGGTWVQEANRQGQRDAQVRRLAESKAAGDSLEVFAAAQDFLVIPRRGGPDPRTEEVWDLYSEALTQWFLGLPDDVDPADLPPLEDYRRALQELPPELQDELALASEEALPQRPRRPERRRPQPRGT